MASIVIVFESRFGQAQKIAEYIADRARHEGHDARVLRASLATHAMLDRADAFVVVAPVYVGQHPREIRTFLRTYNATLSARPLAFVSVCNTAARTDAESRSMASRMAQRTVYEAALLPCVVASVAGALAYPRYGFFTRQMMRLISRRAGGPTDTSRIHELTDWTALDRDLSPFFARKELTLADRFRGRGVLRRGEAGAPS